MYTFIYNKKDERQEENNNLELDIKGDKKLKETINNITTLDSATSTSAVLSPRPLGFAIPRQ